MNEPNIHIQKIIDSHASQKELAEKLGVTPVFVCQMASGQKKVPPRLCVLLERISNHEVTKEILRPDIFLLPNDLTG